MARKTLSKPARTGGSSGGPTGPGAGQPVPPRARRDSNALIEQLGRARRDPYAWLKDDNWREVMRDTSRLRADIRTHLEAENAYTHASLEAPTAALQDQLFEEMRGRIKENDSSVPAIDGPWAYYRRFREGGEYPLFARRPSEHAFSGDESHEQLLIDGDALAKGCDYFDIRKVSHSPDHRLLAYAVDDKGSEFYTTHIIDCATGAEVDAIRDSYGEFVWGEDSKSIFWVARDENARPVSVFCRRLGSGADELVYREADPGFFVGVQKSQSGRFIFVTANDHTTTEWRYLRTDSEDHALTLIAEREAGVDYSVVDFDDRFWIRTNRNGAVDFALVSAPHDTSGRRKLAHRDPASPRRADPRRRTVRRLHRPHGARERPAPHRRARARHGRRTRHRVRRSRLLARHVQRLSLAIAVAALRLLLARPRPRRCSTTTCARASASCARRSRSPPATTPPTTSSSASMRRAMMARWCPSRCCATATRRSMARRPCCSTAMAPTASPFRRTSAPAASASSIAASSTPSPTCADRWPRAISGISMASSRRRPTPSPTSSPPVSISLPRATRAAAASSRMGGSAGGLLMGVAANLDPTLFGGIIAAVPFVDVLNTMSDDTLPLTPPEWPEWGNPLIDADAYDRILAYSPYDQVTLRDYPPMLITGGLTDPRVTYWEPAKWAARLRHEAPEGGPYFLKINMDAGHGGVSGRFASLRETALEFAFALACTGKADGSTWRHGK